MVQLCIVINQLPGFIVKALLNKLKLEAHWLPCTATPNSECTSFCKSPSVQVFEQLVGLAVKLQ